MQQVKDIERHRSLTPRLIAEKNGKVYYSSYYADSEMAYSEKDYEITVKTGLICKGEKAYEAGDSLAEIKPTIFYKLTEKGVEITIENAEGTKFILPLISGNSAVNVGKIEKEEEIFFLTGGFIANEITVLPVNGEIKMIIY